MVPTARIEKSRNQEANSLPPIAAFRDGCIVSARNNHQDCHPIVLPPGLPCPIRSVDRLRLFSYTAAMTPARLAPGATDALLFDLGRVVLDIDFSQAMACWAAHAGCAPADIAARFAADETLRQYESGKIGDADYFARLRNRLGVGISDAQLLEGWNAIFIGEIPGIVPLLARAARRLPLYAFSNTNPGHIAHFSRVYADVLRHFRELYLSSTIGLLKPDAAAYDHVVKAIGVPASRILFFDDLAENVEGARARGLHAVQVKSSADVAAALAALGI
jgi:glucose-1-phosphatase